MKLKLIEYIKLPPAGASLWLVSIKNRACSS